MENDKRLIDIEQAKRATYEEIFWTESEQAAVRNFLTRLPKVNAVEVVHGRWEDEFGGKYANPRYRCSVCKVRANYKMVQDELMSWHEEQALTDYCPNCGAKMDGDGNG